jgi:hypothetical protein
MVPLGGYRADRVRGKGLLIRASTLLSAIPMFSASRTPYALAILIAFGVIAGFPAGAMMALPPRMAVFYTLFYVTMAHGPVIAGRLPGYTDVRQLRSISTDSPRRLPGSSRHFHEFAPGLGGQGNRHLSRRRGSATSRHSRARFSPSPGGTGK